MVTWKNLGPIMVLAAILCVPAITLAKGKKNKDTTPPAPTPVDIQATVEKVDATTVTVQLALTPGPMTTITVDGATKAISDLKAGQKLTLTYKGSDLSTIAATSAAQ